MLRACTSSPTLVRSINNWGLHIRLSERPVDRLATHVYANRGPSLKTQPTPYRLSAAWSAAESGVCKERTHGHGAVDDRYAICGRGEVPRCCPMVRGDYRDKPIPEPGATNGPAIAAPCRARA